MKFKNIKLSESLPDSLVNIDEKKRSNLFTWRGQFSPQLIEYLLTNYASEGDVVFDPFLGSGTILFECALLGLKASGCEINPAAVSFAKIYELINKSKNIVMESLGIIETVVSKYSNNLPFLENRDINDFEPDLLNAFSNEKEEITRTILLSLITGLDFEAKKLDVKRINNVWGTLRSNVENLPYSRVKLQCYHRDARKTLLNGKSINFVLTSPPYINVFNYHQNYRKSIEKTGVDVLTVAKSEIGANRKFRQNRFLTVVQYCMDMSQVFCELGRICTDNAKIIFIVGRESHVRRTSFKNAILISSVAKACGFYLEGEQERLFTNKFGESIYEEILRFSIKNTTANNTLEESRKIGQNALEDALSYCEEEVKNEIKEAIQKSNEIETSPILFGEKIYKEILRFKTSQIIPGKIIGNALKNGQQALKGDLLNCSQEVISEIEMAIEKTKTVGTSNFYNEGGIY